MSLVSHHAYEVQAQLVSNMDIKIIFDVGANKGDTITYYHHLFPEATIYGFEPFPRVFEAILIGPNLKNHVYPIE